MNLTWITIRPFGKAFSLVAQADKPNAPRIFLGTFPTYIAALNYASEVLP